MDGINLLRIPFDIILLVYEFTSENCLVCHLPHLKYNLIYFKECIKNVISEIFYLNSKENNTNVLNRNIIVNNILSYLTINNKCKNCSTLITEFYNIPMNTCTSCYIPLCKNCYDNYSYITQTKDGMFIYFIILNK